MRISRPTEGEDPSFEAKKQLYFTNLALRLRDAFQLHEAEGLWGWDPAQRRGKKVSQHCLAVAARCEVLGDLLHLSDLTQDRLIFAAALHDFYKHREIGLQKEALVAGQPVWDSFEAAEAAAAQKLTDAQIHPGVQSMVGIVGHNGYPEVDALLKKGSHTQDELARLALHYSDLVSTGTNWVQPAKIMEETHEKMNAIDFRMDDLTARYGQLHEEGASHLGAKTYDALRAGSHRIEELFARIMEEKTGSSIDPKDLPTIVDDEIRRRIEKIGT